MKRYLWYLLPFALFALVGHADYLYQAKWFTGWWTWLPLDSSAAKWGFFDFVAHDTWHAVQSVRNHLWIAASIVAVFVGLYAIPGRRWYNYAVIVLLVYLMYGAGRAIGFTLFKDWLF